MRIAISQLDTTPGDFAVTAQRMIGACRAAADKGAELVVFGSSVLGTTDPAGLLAYDEYLSDIVSQLMVIAQETPVPALVPFVTDMEESGYFECCLLNEGSVMPLRMASALESVDDEDSIADAVNGPVLMQFNGINLALAFDDYDLLGVKTSDEQIDVVIFMPYAGLNVEDDLTLMGTSINSSVFTDLASTTNAWIVGAASLGGYGDVVYTGGSFVMAPWGELAHVSPSFEDDLSVVDFEVLSEGPLAEPVTAPVLQRPALLWESIVLSVRDYVTKTGRTSVTLPLDGSLRSAIVAALATDALGPRCVHAIITAQRSAADDARQLADALHIDVQDVDGDALVKAASLLDINAESAGMLVTAILSAKTVGLDAVRLGTCDKTQLAIDAGRADLVCDFAPLGDVWRSDVAQMARYRNTVSPVIPEGCLARLEAPSGLPQVKGLTTDEAILSQVDAVCLLNIEQCLGISAIVSELEPREGIEDFTSAVVWFISMGERYRASLPLMPVVSEYSMTEHNCPPVNAWRDTPRDLDSHLSDEEFRDAAARLFGQAAGLTSGKPAGDSPEDAIGFLRDFAAGGGFDASDGELWGHGLFSDN